MAVIHDSAVRDSIEARLSKLRPDSKGVWGRMTVDQMLWHVNQALSAAVGRTTIPPKAVPIPRGLIRFAVLNLPWTRNAPTSDAFVARANHDFDAERARCLELIAELTAKPIAHATQVHPTFGAMTGPQVSRLQAKHLDHHLRQFGV